MNRFPSTSKQHATNVGRLSCVVSGESSPTLHHCHGRSVGARLVQMGLDPTSGWARRGVSEALIIPLAAKYHTGDCGIDSSLGLLTWERRYGTQDAHIDTVSELLGYDLWELHRLWVEKWDTGLLPQRGK